MTLKRISKEMIVDMDNMMICLLNHEEGRFKTARLNVNEAIKLYKLCEAFLKRLKEGKDCRMCKRYISHSTYCEGEDGGKIEGYECLKEGKVHFSPKI